jgi:hypothetical protein
MTKDMYALESYICEASAHLRHDLQRLPSIVEGATPDEIGTLKLNAQALRIQLGRLLEKLSVYRG